LVPLVSLLLVVVAVLVVVEEVDVLTGVSSEWESFHFPPSLTRMRVLMRVLPS